MNNPNVEIEFSDSIEVPKLSIARRVMDWSIYRSSNLLDNCDRSLT